MKIDLLVIAKTNADYLVQGIAEYQKRLQKYVTFALQVVPDLKNAAHLSTAEIKKLEGKALLKQLSATDTVVLLDERGTQYTSAKFAAYIQQLQNRNTQHLKFVCGGAYGFSDEMYSRANAQLSLSSLTFSHQLVRLLFVEQLYRAFTILHNEPYHHA